MLQRHLFFSVAPKLLTTYIPHPGWTIVKKVWIKGAFQPSIHPFHLSFVFLHLQSILNSLRAIKEDKASQPYYHLCLHTYMCIHTEESLFRVSRKGFSLHLNPLSLKFGSQWEREKSSFPLHLLQDVIFSRVEHTPVSMSANDVQLLLPIGGKSTLMIVLAADPFSCIALIRWMVGWLVWITGRAPFTNSIHSLVHSDLFFLLSVLLLTHGKFSISSPVFHLSIREQPFNCPQTMSSN